MLASTLVELGASDSNAGPAAFLPLAPWSELKRRHQTIADSKAAANVGRQVMLLLPSQLGPAGTCSTITSEGPYAYYLANGVFLLYNLENLTWRFYDGSSPATFAPAAQGASAASDRKKIRELCFSVISVHRSINTEGDRQLMICTFEEII